MKIIKILILSLTVVITSLSVRAIDLEFYFPVAVGGGAAQTIEKFAEDYTKLNPDVNVKAVFTGSYTDTDTKFLTACKSGTAPATSVMIAVTIFKYIDEECVMAWDDILTQDEIDNWIGGFYPAFMANGQVDGKTYGIPFQRSTPVLYYNKDAFRAAGLDPENPPKTWDEQLEVAKKLTIKDSDGNVSHYGIRIPSAGFPYWLFSAIVYGNGGKIMNDNGTETYINSPEAIEALEKLVALSTTEGVMRPGILEWGSTPQAFFEGQTAMMWTTTGNLTNVRNNAPFDWGVAFIPGIKQFGAPVGGGNFYLSIDTTEEEQQATKDFVKWITEPKQSVAWTKATGYVAPRAETWESDEMKEFLKEFPYPAVARDQLEYAGPEFSTYEQPKTVSIFNRGLEAAVAGEKDPKTALLEAHAEIDKILKDYR